MDISFNILKLIFYSHSRYFLEHDGANFKFPLQICPILAFSFLPISFYYNYFSKSLRGTRLKVIILFSFAFVSRRRET